MRVNIFTKLGQINGHNIREIKCRSFPPVVYWRSNFSHGRGCHGHPECGAQCQVAESGAATTAQRGVWKEAGKRLILNVLEVLHVCVAHRHRVSAHEEWLQKKVHISGMQSELVSSHKEPVINDIIVILCLFVYWTCNVRLPTKDKPGGCYVSYTESHIIGCFVTHIVTQIELTSVDMVSSLCCI